MLPEVRRQPSTSSSRFQDWRQGIRQGTILPHHSTLQETLRKELWTLRNHSATRIHVIHPSTSGVYASGTPRLSCLDARAGSFECHPKSYRRPTATDRDRRRGRVRDR